MKAFEAHRQIVDDYRNYLRSFSQVSDERIHNKVSEAFENSGFIPDPLIQFNPTFAKEASLEQLDGVHPDLTTIFGEYTLYKHQVEALLWGIQKKEFIVTSGTGSGKSLTFLATIFNDILQSQNSEEQGIKAVLVYPMNALINSQEGEIQKYADQYEKVTGNKFPITFAKYTGQEGQEKREAIKSSPPNIILTNYMMLELIMTRTSESWMRESFKRTLEYLVFDELHTYRGRQGADVSLLIRRIRQLAQKHVICIGTSATMASEGSFSDRRKTVAAVGTKIFGVGFDEEQIISETLETCTHASAISPTENIQASLDNLTVTAPYQEFLNHPLAQWLENAIALDRSDPDRVMRSKPMTLPAISEKLADYLSIGVKQAMKALTKLLEWSEELNKKHAKERKSFLPFKFHQFISQTNTVYVTLESRENRSISIQSGRYEEGDPNKKDYLVYPLLFSRMSGVEFICVKKDVENDKLLPRDPDQPGDNLKRSEAKKRTLSEADFTDGYLLLQDEGQAQYWDDEMIESLPSSWFRQTKTPQLNQYFSWQLPKLISFNEYGDYSYANTYPLKGWFIPTPLRIDPTSGVIYEDSKTREHTKLMRLGNEGRSTATTITAFSVIRRLHEQGEPSKNQKLLSFTDNRQDASLQAGHFNDFIATVRLRAALHKALEKDAALTVVEVANRVRIALNLSEEEYAEHPNDFMPDPDNEKALERQLFIRLLYDLRRSWRYTLPNLEQCGLLEIDYRGLEEYSLNEKVFADFSFLQEQSPKVRQKLSKLVLDFFRTSYALQHNLLDSGQRSELENFIKLKLNDKTNWGMEPNESVEVPRYLTINNPGQTGRGIYTASIGGLSTLGKYLKKKYTEYYGVDKMSRKEYEEFMNKFCEALQRGNFLTKPAEIQGSNGTVKGYQLRTDCLIWRRGKGIVPIDEVRVSTLGDPNALELKPNSFFRDLYQIDFTAFDKPFVAREHTGQVPTAEREEREESFREGKISALACSPTMELGIDIADLNIVHMRNAPPNPANYAQRSGRAGRSGQTALVFNYCSAFSPHDRHYFNKKEEMVAGVVAPPQIDLLNEELIKNHLNAFVLMDMRLGELSQSVADVIDISVSNQLPLKSTIVDHIKDHLKHHGEALQRQFQEVLDQLPDNLEDTTWFSSSWLKKQMDSFLERFNAAFDRWRILYRNAEAAVLIADQVVKDRTVKYDSEQARDARRQRNIGELQLALLRNDRKSQFGSNSEFYVFRYLASEGFLPGYNFTRLPIRAFAGYKFKEEGEYISRPRFIALREFGPQNLIYHNGRKFRIQQMSLADGQLKTENIKVSDATQYALTGEESKNANNDPITGAALKVNSNATLYTMALELGESDARPQERISCQEEERMSQGFEIEQFFRYPKGIEQTQKAIIKQEGTELLRLIYGASTELIQLNKKWKRATDDAFYIHKENGKWLRKAEVEKDKSDPPKHAQVQLFTKDTADTLYIQPVEALGLEEQQVISLSYALKRGIERLFQVEESEIGVWLMGKDTPNIMIYEAAEGTLGLLSQLVASPAKMKELFEEAYKAMHFNIETKEDTQPQKPKATYEDLLSYYNQPYHDKLDRHAVKAPLEKLMEASIEEVRNNRDRQQQYQFLLEQYDKNSSTERQLIDYLYENGYALPDKAQVNVPDFYISVDFVYNLESGPVLIFCDGSVHDKPKVKEEDRHKRKHLSDAGYDVIEWHYTEKIEELIARRSDVFRKIS